MDFSTYFIIIVKLIFWILAHTATLLQNKNDSCFGKFVALAEYYDDWKDLVDWISIPSSKSCVPPKTITSGESEQRWKQPWGLLPIAMITYTTTVIGMITYTLFVIAMITHTTLVIGMITLAWDKVEKV